MAWLRRLAILLAVAAVALFAGARWLDARTGGAARPAEPAPLRAAPHHTAGFDPGARLPADPVAGEGFFAGSRPAGALPAALPATLAAASRSAGLRHLGIHVRDLESGATVYARHADELSLLASNTKLFTTAAALDALGPGAFLETRLLSRGEVGPDGVLDGDLAVVGGGDPTFSWRLGADGDAAVVFRAWASALRRRGVERVGGHLHLVHGLFEGPSTHPDWDPAKRLKWYQAPVAALTFNEATVKVRAVPAGRPGLPARVEVEPALGGMFRIGGTVLTAPSWSGNRLLVHRPEGGGEISVAGGVYVRAGEVEMPIAVDDPVAYFAAALVAAFAEEGVTVAGRPLARAALPGLESWEEVAVHRTPLLDVLEVTNHESQNLFAESLVKRVGVARCGAGSWRRGVKAVEELALALGVDPAGLVLADGSGLSPANRAAPRQVTAFLAGMARHPHRGAFVATLPTGGEAASSLEERLDRPPWAGRVYAKTGTLAGVSTLSGYARGRTGRLYAFSVLTRGTVSRGRRVQDGLVRVLISQG